MRGPLSWGIGWGVALAWAAALAQGPATGGIAGKVAAPRPAELVVYVEDAPASAAQPPQPRPQLVQRNTAFVPEVVVVQKGQPVDFPNEDKFFHNVFSATPGSEFDLGLYRGGASRSNRFDQPGEVEVYCNIHESMRALILVVPNGFYTRAAPDGSYSLSGLPPGEYTVVAWSPAFKPQRQKAKVQAGAQASANFTLSAPRETAATHLNKDGEQYGRYK